MLTARADKLSVFEKLALRVFPLSADRTRAGRAPTFAVETEVSRWRRAELVVRDVDGDGRDDLLVVGPLGPARRPARRGLPCRPRARPLPRRAGDHADRRRRSRSASRGRPDRRRPARSGAARRRRASRCTPGSRRGGTGWSTARPRQVVTLSTAGEAKRVEVAVGSGGVSARSVRGRGGRRPRAAAGRPRRRRTIGRDRRLRRRRSGRPADRPFRPSGPSSPAPTETLPQRGNRCRDGMLRSAVMNLVDPRDRRPQRIAVLPGDGIGRDVTAEATKVLEAAAERWSLPLELVHEPWSADHYLATGVSIPPGTLERYRDEFAAIFIGAYGDPRVPDMRHAADILLGTRFKLDLYINFRPCKLLDARLCPLKGKTRVRRRLRGLPREHRGRLRRHRRQLQEGHARRSGGAGGDPHPQGGRAHHPRRLRVGRRPRPPQGLHGRQVERHALCARPLAARLRRGGDGVPVDRRLAPVRRRAHHATGAGAGAVRGDRHQQHVRRHHHRPRSGAAGRPRRRRLGQPPPGAHLDVRARARLGAEARRQRAGQSGGGGALRRADAREPRARARRRARSRPR